MVKHNNRFLLAPSSVAFYVLSVLVFYLAVKYIAKLENIRALLLQIRASWLFIVVALQAVTYVLNALILQTLLQNDKGKIRLGALYQISVVVLFINQTLPTGGISGNGYIFNQLVKRKVHALKAFTVLILESVGYYIAFLLLLGSFFVWYCYHVPVINTVVGYTVLLGYLFFGTLTCLMFLISNKHTLAFILKKLNRFKFARRYLQRIHLNFRAYYTIKLRQYIISKPMFIVIGLQVSIIWADVVTVYCLMHGFQINMVFADTAFAVLLSMIIGSLPVSPGALIAYESAMTYFLTLMGAPLHAAIVVTLLYRFFSFWLPIPVGIMLYRKLKSG